MKLANPFRFKLPLPLLLIIPFVVQIFAVVGLIGYLSFQNGRAAVDDLANALIDETKQLCRYPPRELFVPSPRH
jgi:hypothetical protein